MRILRFAASGLGIFCVATAFLFHGGLATQNELLHFERDLAIAGGMFVLLVKGAGDWSVDALFAAGSSQAMPGGQCRGRTDHAPGHGAT